VRTFIFTFDCIFGKPMLPAAEAAGSITKSLTLVEQLSICRSG
jgi:hypothetical protein